MFENVRIAHCKEIPDEPLNFSALLTYQLYYPWHEIALDDTLQEINNKPETYVTVTLPLLIAAGNTRLLY